MSLHELQTRSDIPQNSNLARQYAQLGLVIAALNNRDLPGQVADAINGEIDRVNAVSGADKDLKKQVRKAQYAIFKLVEKELKLVTKNHYRRLWMVLGMTIFGVLLGVAFGASLGNMAFLGLGLPIGMAIGIGVGTVMDKKAATEGRQLDVDLKY